MIDPDRWLVLEVRVRDAELRPLLAEALLALGGASVEEQGDRLTTYLLPPRDPDSFREDAEALLRESVPPPAPEVAWCWQRNEDWAQRWKQGLGARRVTPRLTVKPSWTEWSAAPGEMVIEIDPQMAFGTGEHGTTRGCLRLLDSAVRPGDRVLDVGSGSGILAIAAARLGACEVVAVECDPDANLNARDNLAHNGVADRVRIVEALADDTLLAELGGFDLVAANILSGVIRPLLPAFFRSLADASEGRLIVSGILRTEQAEVTRDAAAASFRVVRVDEEEDERDQAWWSALLVPGG